MNNVITCLSDSYSASRRETYESIVNYISYFKQLESHLQQLQNHLYGWYFKSLVTVVPLTGENRLCVIKMLNVIKTFAI